MNKVNKEIKFKGVIDCDFSFLTLVCVYQLYVAGRDYNELLPGLVTSQTQKFT